MPLPLPASPYKGEETECAPTISGKALFFEGSRGSEARQWRASVRAFLWIWGRGQAESADSVVEPPTECRQGSSRSSYHRLQFYRRQLEPGVKAGAVGVFEESAAELLIGEEFAQDLLNGALAHGTLNVSSVRA